MIDGLKLTVTGGELHLVVIEGVVKVAPSTPRTFMAFTFDTGSIGGQTQVQSLAVESAQTAVSNGQ